MTQPPYRNFSKDAYKRLSPEANLAISQFFGPQPKSWLLQTFFSWIVILASILISEFSNSMIVMIVAMMVIATRQNILGLLVHEQAHCLGFKAKLGNLIANLFCAYPLLVLTVEGYAKVHLAHHKYFFDEEKDPDIRRKKGLDWVFPMKISRLIKILLSDISSLNTISLFAGKREKDPKALKDSSTHRTRIIFFALLEILLTVTGAWRLFLFYWMIPLLSFFQVIVRWGAICEHRYSKDLTLE